MLSTILAGLVSLSALRCPPPSSAVRADTLSVSGQCWDVSTGADLKARISATVGAEVIKVGESNAVGQFAIHLPDSTRFLTFEVEGYPTTTVPVHMVGKPGKNDRFGISLPMINPDSQQVVRNYPAVLTPGKKPEKPPQGAKEVYFQAKDARTFRRLPATVCFTDAGGRTHCAALDSVRIPSAVGLKPGENFAFEVRSAGYQTYRGKLVVGPSGSEDVLYQIKLLRLNNVLAMAYDVPETLKIQYEFRVAKNRAVQTRFDVPLSYFEWNLFKPGETYELRAATEDGRLLLTDQFTMEPGFNFKVNRLPKPVSPNLPTASGPDRFFDSTVLYFAQSDYTLRKDAKGKLDSISWLLIRQRGLVAQLTGHTDNVGNRDLNLTLSEYRTRVVASYLQQKGIQPHQLSPTWRGPDSPAAPNDTEENKTKNRRVVVRLFPK
ncbi:hypothetical protein GCM10027299_43880 [Larkinella ripae]